MSVTTVYNCQSITATTSGVIRVPDEPLPAWPAFPTFSEVDIECWDVVLEDSSSIRIIQGKCEHTGNDVVTSVSGDPIDSITAERFCQLGESPDFVTYTTASE